MKSKPARSYLRRHIWYFLVRIGLIKLKGTPVVPGEKPGLSRLLPRKHPTK